MIRTALLCLAAALSFHAAATAQLSKEDERKLNRMMSGLPGLEGKELEQAIASAETHPLGSRENPVRVEGPAGQRSYLSQLRCADGAPPKFQRSGNVGSGPYGSIVDLYAVDCGASAPGQVQVFMDMYFRGHVEARAVPGFTTAGAGTKT